MFCWFRRRLINVVINTICSFIFENYFPKYMLPFVLLRGLSPILEIRPKRPFVCFDKTKTRNLLATSSNYSLYTPPISNRSAIPLRTQPCHIVMLCNHGASLTMSSTHGWSRTSRASDVPCVRETMINLVDTDYKVLLKSYKQWVCEIDYIFSLSKQMYLFWLLLPQLDGTRRSTIKRLSL